MTLLSYLQTKMGKCVRSVKLNRANYKTKRMPESLDYDLAKKFFVWFY